ncbi:glycosyltransferase family 4 protein [Nitrosomonas sp. Nm58]|uniref:glycosyltransferase family 4 protein n=1 Tax=Nitrosomonas sp. Nm58 TaxID=200126 RepID=UPI000895FD34|nr:glycosyltransferase family 4 protein [Nitrosomonas sp. Nm58]SDY68427.1 phenylacetate-CoA ligase [Nitrosomonas sp. Nm58]
MKVSELYIGLVGPLPPPSGGMANQTEQLARLLRQEGAQIKLIQVNSPYYPEWINKIKGIRALFRLIPYLINLWRSADTVQLFHVMANSGWSWHLYAAPVIWIARIKKKPAVINYRGGEAEAFFEKSFFWVKPSLELAAAVIVPSDFLEEIFKKRGFATIIVPNIINLDRFSEQTDKRNQKIAKAPHIILTRNLEAIYDNATAIRAFYQVRSFFSDARLTIAGSGPEELALNALVRELGLVDAVTFTGRVDNEAIISLYRSADVMVNPSLVDNMPISILEALACGVPVVSTNVGGIPYLVAHDKTALLVPPQDPIAMSRAILTLLNDPIKARKIAEAGLITVQQYTWRNVQNRLLSVYEQVLAKSFN